MPKCSTGGGNPRGSESGVRGPGVWLLRRVCGPDPGGDRQAIAGAADPNGASAICTVRCSTTRRYASAEVAVGASAICTDQSPTTRDGPDPEVAVGASAICTDQSPATRDYPGAEVAGGASTICTYTKIATIQITNQITNLRLRGQPQPACPAGGERPSPRGRRYAKALREGARTPTHAVAGSNQSKQRRGEGVAQNLAPFAVADELTEFFRERRPG